jgi:hypothetical protein
LTWLQLRKYIWNVFYQIKYNKVSPSENISWQLQKIYTIIILLKRWHNPSRVSSSNFCIPLSYRFIQQLEDALNFSLCGHFLILLVTMCTAAFSVVTVQYNISWSFIFKNNTSVKLEAVQSGRSVLTCCMHPQGRTFIDYLQARLWQLRIALINKISISNYTRKIAFITTGKFYVFN